LLRIDFVIFALALLFLAVLLASDVKKFPEVKSLAWVRKEWWPFCAFTLWLQIERNPLDAAVRIISAQVYDTAVQAAADSARERLRGENEAWLSSQQCFIQHRLMLEQLAFRLARVILLSAGI
jgi:hypothetical protein